MLGARLTFDAGQQHWIFSKILEGDYAGKTLEEGAQVARKDPSDVYVDLASKDRSPTAIVFQQDMGFVRKLAQRDYVFTASDGLTHLAFAMKAHPRMYGTFTRKIRQFALDEKLIDLNAVISQTLSEKLLLQLDDHRWQIGTVGHQVGESEPLGVRFGRPVLDRLPLGQQCLGALHLVLRGLDLGGERAELLILRPCEQGAYGDDHDGNAHDHENELFARSNLHRYLTYWAGALGGAGTAVPGVCAAGGEGLVTFPVIVNTTTVAGTLAEGWNALKLPFAALVSQRSWRSVN